MPKFIKKISKTSGLLPGELVYVGDHKTDKVKITVIDYDTDQFQEKELKSIEECFPFKDKPSVTWINVDGIHAAGIIEKIGRNFNLHPLVLEDILNTGQRPKYEDFGGYIFIVLKMLYYDAERKETVVEQVSLITGSNFVISFQEKEGDVFNAIRERIRNAKGRIRKSASDYLTYSLIDAIIDNYFLILEKIGEEIELIEEELITNPMPKTLQKIHNLKREALFLRKSVWPLREVISGLGRGESSLVKEPTKIYLRDIYDHTIQVIDTVETLRDMASGMLDIYLSSLSHRMNEVMKVLTIIATLFIPLTFIAGIYGMNFKYMPELNWPWGYLMVWLVMISIGIFMVFYFKRKKWI